MGNSMECKIGEPYLNSCQICYIHLRANTLKERYESINLPCSYGFDSTTEWVI